MFDNIIGQQKIITVLKNQITDKQLPSSMLFYGDKYNGKLTTALELARILTCDTETAQWNCSCSSCEKQRRQVHPNLLLLGDRYFSVEIAASTEVLLRNQKPFAQYLCARAVRKLTQRFNPVLWDRNNPKYKNAQPLLMAVEELLDLIAPGQPPLDNSVLEENLNKIKALTLKLGKILGTFNISIDHIRKIRSWVHTTGPGRNKIIIIENAENMLESARNSLLKILEEPPPSVYFLILAQDKEKIIPTILSRLRAYHFPKRSAKEDQQVLIKIFREKNDEYEDLNDYFLGWSEINHELLRNFAGVFLKQLWDPHAQALFNDQGTESSLPIDADSLKSFLVELTAQLSARLRENSQGINSAIPRLEQFEQWNRLIRACLIQFDRYNQNPSLLLESLYYQMRTAQ